MKKNMLGKIYEGLGFAEALIALMIAGMVGIVLMRISASTLRELAQLDIQDAIAQYAVSTSVDLQKLAIADLILNEDDKLFRTDMLIEGNCYNFDNMAQQVFTNITCPDPLSSSINRESFSKIPNTKYFRVIKVISHDTKKAVLQIVVGVTEMAGVNTSNKDIKDYSYLVTIVK